ncbi:MAG: hemerythrin domain-containing protein [Chitinophagaceae bacterium]|nr:hemerythrin domain-containing protein [Chitinophagaceae bacterium]
MTPLKRHPALVPLSQDHHHGLMLVLKIKKGMQYGVEARRMSAYLQHEFEEALLPHFREEEQGVFMWLPEADAMRIRALDEHHRMEALAGSIAEDPENISLLRLFIVLLETHIRFEERVLFPHLQECFPEHLNKMAPGLQATASCHVGADWPDHFWLPLTP